MVTKGGEDGEDQRERRVHRQMGVPYIKVTGTMAQRVLIASAELLPGLTFGEEASLTKLYVMAGR